MGISRQKEGEQGETWVVRQLTDDFKTIGMHKYNATMKSDGENSVKDVKQNKEVEQP